MYDRMLTGGGVGGGDKIRLNACSRKGMYMQSRKALVSGYFQVSLSYGPATVETRQASA